jgi:membrane protein required for colicin V production
MIFDIVVVIILLASALFAFFRGFIRETLTILGVVGGTVASYFLGGEFSPHVLRLLGGVETEGEVEGEATKLLFGTIPYPLLADILSYGIIFLFFVIILSVISHLLASWAKSIGLGIFDRMLGILFGLVRGGLFIALLYLPVYLLIEKEERDEWKMLQNSHTRVYVEMTSEWVNSMIPESEEAAGEAGDEVRIELESVAREVHKKMQELDIVDPNEITEKPQEMKENSTGTNIGDDTNSGYDKNTRENLDNLLKRALEE